MIIFKKSRRNSNDSIYCRACRNPVARVQDYIWRVRRTGIFSRVYDVLVSNDENYRLGSTIAKTYCSQCGTLLGWKFIVVPLWYVFGREGRSVLFLRELCFWNGVPLLHLNAHQDLGANDQNAHQDLGANELVHSALNIRGGAQTGRGGSQTDQCGGHRSAHIDGGQSEPVLCMFIDASETPVCLHDLLETSIKLMKFLLMKESTVVRAEIQLHASKIIFGWYVHPGGIFSRVQVSYNVLVSDDIEVPRWYEYVREGRFILKLSELSVWNGVSLLHLGANEQNADQDGDSTDQDEDANEQNVDQDGDASTLRFVLLLSVATFWNGVPLPHLNEEQDLGANEQNVHQDGDATTIRFLLFLSVVTFWNGVPLPHLNEQNANQDLGANEQNAHQDLGTNEENADQDGGGNEHNHDSYGGTPMN
ncbi:hypothetical protein KY285_020801 [Solanum tuberosum]|nr:hypothetical protein KY285_020801 [Solanum tuberosum]